MTELEVYGSFVSSLPVLSIVQDPQDYGTAPGRVAKFSVLPKVLNGDPAKITFQWQKNDANIPGATAANYVTGPLADADLGTKFRVVVSYPGVADVLSKEAAVVFDYNYAKGQPALNNSPLWPPGNWNIAMLVDGDHGPVFHLDTAPKLGAAYWVDLGTEIAIDKIQIWPRQDGCCPERFTNLRVTVHKDASGALGDPVWQADIFTDGTNPGSGPGIVVALTKEKDAAGTFTGQWVRVQSLDNPVPDYGLQMTELEVFGHPTTAFSPKPQLEFARTSNGFKLTWTTGTLESAPQVTGPFATVQNAVSPFDVVPSGSGRFYRLRQ
jgi:hypothetical protein